MAWVAFGLFVKRISPDYPFPFLSGADEEVSIKIEPFSGLSLQQVFKLGGRRTFVAKNQVAALKQRLGLKKAQFRQKIAQIRHVNRLVASKIDSPKEGYVD